MNSQILDKVRKLRLLAQSANVNEASNAAAAAEKLIQEYRIAEAELADIAEDAAPISDLIVEQGTSAVSWRALLISTLCYGYSCAVWQSSKRAEDFRTRLAWAIIGTPSDVETVKYQFAYLTTEILRLAASHPIKLKGKTEFNSFYLGAARGIGAKMAEANAAARTQARESNSQALVRLDARLERAKQAMPGNLRRKASSSRIGDSDAYDAGYSAGKNIHQGNALGHGGTRLLGGKR